MPKNCCKTAAGGSHVQKAILTVNLFTIVKTMALDRIQFPICLVRDIWVPPFTVSVLTVLASGLVGARYIGAMLLLLGATMMELVNK